jgi:hypothetical protein
MTGKQLLLMNQTTTPAANKATMNWASRSHLDPAPAKAATPRGVNGSHAMMGLAGALIARRLPQLKNG